MLHSIQALRILSAIWVVLYHARNNPAFAPASGMWHTFSSFGYLGVDIFFVISGFIMAMNTAERPAGAQHAVRFFAVRCARIYSGWWPVFLICLLLYGINGQLQGKDFWGSFFLYQLNFNVLVLPITWTLTYELYFYAIVALSLLLPREWRGGALWAFSVVVIAATVWWIVGDRYSEAQFERTNFAMYLFLSPLCLEFLLGYMLQRHRERLQLRIPVLALLTLASAAGLYYYATYVAYKASGLSGFFHYPERALLAGLFAGCSVCLFLRLEKWLPYRLSLWGGDISYMVYLLHLPTLWLISRFVAPALPQGMPLACMGLALVATLALSALVHFTAEQPAYRLSKRLL